MIGSITRGKDFKGVLRYIFDKEAATLLHSNIPAAFDTPTSAATAMTRVATRNHRVAKPVYHIAVSPSQTETLDEPQWAMFGDRLLEELGLKDRQFVMGLHNDANYPNSTQPRTHAHIVVNLINFHGQRADTSWDYYRIQTAMRTLEREFELDSPFLANHAHSPSAKPDTKGQYGRYQREHTEYEDSSHPRSQPPERSHRKQLQQYLDRALEEADGWDSLENMLQYQGIIIHCSNRGWALELDGTYFAGYQLGKKYTYPSVVKSLESERMSEEQTTVTTAPNTGIGTALATADPLLDNLPLEAEVLDSKIVPTPKDIAKQALADGIQHTDRVLGESNQFMGELSQPEMLDGAFLLEQTGKTLKIGTELLTEIRQTSSAESPSTPEMPDNSEIPLSNTTPALPEGPIDADVVEDLHLEGTNNVLSAHQWDEQDLANTLSSFVEVRANAHDLPPDQSVQTSIGTLTVSDDSIQLIGKPSEPVTVETPGGLVSTGESPLFEATKGDNGWDVSTNILSDEAKLRIEQLPTTPEAYKAHQEASVVVKHILNQADAQDVPINEVEQFELNSQSGHHYDFALSHNDDGTHITGEDLNGASVFDVTLRADNTLAVAHSTIDDHVIDQLKQLESESQHTQSPRQREQLERSPGKAQER